MTLSLILAILAGLGFAVAQLGKRYGASQHDFCGTAPHVKLTSNCLVAVVYMCGAAIPSLLVSLFRHQEALAVYAFPGWRERLGILVVCGALEGLGTALSVVILGFAGKERMSSVAASLMNSTVAAGSPCLIALIFNEPFNLMTRTGICLVALGFSMASGEIDKKVASITKHVQSDGLINDVSSVSSTALIIGSLVVGILWSFGCVGFRYGNLNMPEGFACTWPAVTALAIHPACIFIPAVVSSMLTLSSTGRLDDLDAELRQRGPVAFVCGTLAGLGGLLLNYSLSLSKSSGALHSGVANGVFLLVSVLLLATIYNEPLTYIQILGIATLAGAIVLLCMA